MSHWLLLPFHYSQNITSFKSSNYILPDLCTPIFSLMLNLFNLLNLFNTKYLSIKLRSFNFGKWEIFFLKNKTKNQRMFFQVLQLRCDDQLFFFLIIKWVSTKLLGSQKQWINYRSYHKKIQSLAKLMYLQKM